MSVEGFSGQEAVSKLSNPADLHKDVGDLVTRRIV